MHIFQWACAAWQTEKQSTMCLIMWGRELGTQGVAVCSALVACVSCLVGLGEKFKEDSLLPWIASLSDDAQVWSLDPTGRAEHQDTGPTTPASMLSFSSLRWNETTSQSLRLLNSHVINFSFLRLFCLRNLNVPEGLLSKVKEDTKRSEENYL